MHLTGMKLLILYHEASSTFFPAYWSRWKRIAKGASVDLDNDKGSGVAHMSTDEVLLMNEAYRLTPLTLKVCSKRLYTHVLYIHAHDHQAHAPAYNHSLPLPLPPPLT